MQNTRRNFLKKSMIAGAGLASAGYTTAVNAQQNAKTSKTVRPNPIGVSYRTGSPDGF
jgi:hypothetical protein